MTQLFRYTIEDLLCSMFPHLRFLSAVPRVATATPLARLLGSHNTVPDSCPLETQHTDTVPVTKVNAPDFWLKGNITIFPIFNPPMNGFQLILSVRILAHFSCTYPLRPKYEKSPKWHQQWARSPISIYNRVNICDWQSGVIAPLTFIVLLPAGAECWHAMTGKRQDPCSLSASPPAGEACVCTPGVGGGGGRRWRRQTERMGGWGGWWIKLVGVELQAISIFSISLWICKPDRSSRHQWLSSPWNSRKRE